MGNNITGVLWCTNGLFDVKDSPRRRWLCFGVLFLLLNVPSMNQGRESNGTKQDPGPCDSHKHCWQCVQDPCSRRVRFDECFWCNKFTEGGPKCSSADNFQSCLDPFPSSDTKNCLQSEPQSVKDQEDVTEVIPCLFVHSNYTVEFPTSDISASQTAGNKHYDVWINMCGKLKNTKVTETCGVFSPIEVIQQQNDSDLRVCWDIGQPADIQMCNVTEDSNPGKGLVVYYGKAKCCSNKEVIPGKFATIAVTVTIVTDSSDGSQTSSTIQSFGNLSRLTGCSEGDSINFVVATSQLTDKRIDWRLDVSNTALYCKEKPEDDETWGPVLPCSVYPVPVIPAHNVSGKICKKHFTVKLYYKNATHVVHSLSYFKTWNNHDELSFLIPKTDLAGFEVDYSYTNKVPEPVTGGISNPVNFPDNSSMDRTKIIYLIGAGLAVLSVIVTVGVVVACRRRRCRGSDPRYDYLDGHDGSTRCCAPT